MATARHGNDAGTAGDAELLRRLSESIRGASLERIADSMVEAIFAGVPAVGEGADLRADQVAAVRATSRSFLVSLGVEPWEPPAVSGALTDLARTLAGRGFEVTTLIKITRYAQAAYWPALMASIERQLADPATLTRVLVTVYERFSRFLEHELDAAVSEFQRERDRLLRGASARRAQTVRALLAGERLDIDVASRATGYELRRHHTALAVWAPDADTTGMDRMEELTRRVSAACGNAAMLVSPSSAHGLWVWVGTWAPPTAEVVDRLRALTLPDGVRASIGQTMPGLAGFVQSHREALAAARVAEESTPATGLVWHADTELVSLLSHDPLGLRALVRRELGPLVRGGAAEPKLRATTLAYLRNTCSPTATARELGTHKNTVRYRIEQVERALGRRLVGQELRLQLTLMVVETLGEHLLRDPDG